MRYTLAYLGLCAATVALLVFLNSTQPFVLSQVYHSTQTGSASSALSLVDEVVAVLAAPLWGALSDKIGTRYVAVLGLLLAAAALYAYPRMPAIVPFLLIVRGVFALGAAAAVSMVTAALGELSLLASNAPSHGQLDSSNPIGTSSALRFDDEGDSTVPLFAPADDVYDAVLAAPRPNGRLAGLAGFSSGLGAVFAVAALLPLPTLYGGGAGGAGKHRDPDPHGGAAGLRVAFRVVSVGTVLVALALFPTLYQNPARGLRLWHCSTAVSIFDEAAVDAEGNVMTYRELLAEGFGAARNDRRLQVAYFGSMVARAASVVLALFVPLWVNAVYYQTGRCHLDDSCHAAITRAAVLTGVASTLMLMLAPLVGMAGDRFGSVPVLAMSSLTGVVGMACFLVGASVDGLLPILACCLLGAAQIGVMTMSMSMSTDKRRLAGGSVAGVYSLCGSLGILLVTQIGGPLADAWLKAPFVVMLVMFAGLYGITHVLGSRTMLRTRTTTVSSDGSVEW